MIKSFVLFLILLYPTYKVMGQASNRFPAPFYALRTDGEKAFYLKKIISDSIGVRAYSRVPEWCHIALGFAKKSKKDTLSPILYQYLGDAYDASRPDSAAIYFRKSLAAYQNIPLKKKLYLLQSLAYNYQALNKKDSLIAYIHKLEKAIKPLSDKDRRKISATTTIASSYAALNEYENAIKNYRLSVRQSMLTKDSAGIVAALVNIGLTYNQLDDNRLAIYYTLQALPYLGKNDYHRLVTYFNLTDYYTNIENQDSVRYFLTKAKVIAVKLKDDEAIHAIGIKEARVLMAEKNYAPAKVALQEGLNYLLKKEPGTELINCLLTYASLDTAQNNYGEADRHLNLVLDFAKKIDVKVYQLEALRLHIAVKQHLGQYKQAFELQKDFIAINDSIKTENAQKELAELQTEYQTSRKEEKIRLLQKENQIKDLEIEASFRNKTLLITLILSLIFVFGVVYYIRQLRGKTALQNLKSTLEMKALRSQMNPHFIFNSLNSIQKYIWENRQEDASEYLTKFARLIRLVLENSLYESVKLTDELASLRLYVEMEHRRNNQKFYYTISVAENIDTESTLIPPLLLQPYIENAIWHGLSQKDGHGRLDIVIEKTAESLICRIEDDGIGRAKSAEIKVDGIQKKSLAMNISSQRIEWLKNDSNVRSSVEIIDKFDGNESTGTIVLLTLPLLQKHD
ncbi:histidine kinase [Dyadobacter sp. OTU695]|uniref:histidine kinase n=1 Tax=Dyadobacter sp. OTU695 TaxID=3043860 RepID=UPI00313C9EB5